MSGIVEAISKETSDMSIKEEEQVDMLKVDFHTHLLPRTVSFYIRYY